jgi:hypothetical protein
MVPCMITTISFGMLLRSSTCADRSRKPSSSAPSAIPIGRFRPSKATVMPANPSPVGNSLEYLWENPSRCGRPTSPAMAPEISIVLTTIAFCGTPLACAAHGLTPLARRSKPKRVRWSRIEYPIPTSTATIKKP